VHSIVLKYRSGEEIRKGDHVLFHGNPAEIELVASNSNDPEAAWYIKEYGGGVIVSDPMVSCRTFIRKGRSTNTRIWSSFLERWTPRSKRRNRRSGFKFPITRLPGFRHKL